MSFGGGAPTPDTRARDILSQISKGQRDIYNTNYLPVQKKLQEEISDPNFIQNTRDSAVKQVGIGAAGSQGAAQRTRSRFGITVSPDKKAAMDRRFNLATSNQKTNVANQAGRAAYDMQTAGMAGITDLGHADARRSLNTASNMARLESNRNRFNANASAQDQAGTIGAIGQIGGMAAMAMLA